MTSTLDSPPRLALLDPKDVPSETALAAWSRSLAAAGKRTRAAGVRAATARAAVEEIEQLLAEFPPGQGVVASVSEQPDDAAHDDYFRVARVRGEAPAVFARMAWGARLCFLRDVIESPVNVDVEVVAQIDAALADLSAAIGARGRKAGKVARWTLRPGAVGADHALTRWVRGHQVFAALSQGLIFSFQAMGRAIKAADRNGIQRWAELSLSLLDGSGAAFVFTGDFSTEMYNTALRPTMMPPAAPISLSGLMSLDHRVLTLTIRDMRPALNALYELEPELHASLQEGLGNVYDRHIHVCERFVGARPSLRTQRQAKKSGPQLLEHFKALRLKTFEVQPHASRLDEGCPVASAVHRDGAQTQVSSSIRTSISRCPKDL